MAEEHPEGKSVSLILREALALYRRHFRVFLATAAVLFVPAALVKSCVLATVAAPALARFESSVDRLAPLARRAQQSLGGYEDAVRDGEIDVQTLDRLEKAATDSKALLAEEAGSFRDWIGRKLVAVAIGILVVALALLAQYGLVVPAVQAAVTVVVADRLAGGTADWRRAWSLVLRRLPGLGTSLLLSSLFTLVGFLLFVFPGVVLYFLFSFVAPVVLLEGRGGAAALKRSARLAASDWIEVVLVLCTFAALAWLCHLLAGLVVPTSMRVWGGFLGDLVTLLLLPFPIIGTVLLYLDLRTRAGELANDRLRAELAAIGSAPGASRRPRDPRP